MKKYITTAIILNFAFALSYHCANAARAGTPKCSDGYLMCPRSDGSSPLALIFSQTFGPQGCIPENISFGRATMGCQNYQKITNTQPLSSHDKANSDNASIGNNAFDSFVSSSHSSSFSDSSGPKGNFATFNSAQSIATPQGKMTDIDTPFGQEEIVQKPGSNVLIKTNGSPQAIAQSAKQAALNQIEMRQEMDHEAQEMQNQEAQMNKNFNRIEENLDSQFDKFKFF
jgi:hypothetical protein